MVTFFKEPRADCRFENLSITGRVTWYYYTSFVTCILISKAVDMQYENTKKYYNLKAIISGGWGKMCINIFVLPGINEMHYAGVT